MSTFKRSEYSGGESSDSPMFTFFYGRNNLTRKNDVLSYRQAIKKLIGYTDRPQGPHYAAKPGRSAQTANITYADKVGH